MNIEDIKKNLTDKGENPDDYNITQKGLGYSVNPKWYVEHKRIAQKEDKPIIQDVNDVAELTTVTSMDKDELAETLTFALQRIDQLQAEVEALKNG